MNAGKMVEYADFKEVYENPKKDYTKKLLNTIPKGIQSEDCYK